MLRENQTAGQRIRGWKVEWPSDHGSAWEEFGTGESIGNKRIVLAASAQSHRATNVRLTITASYGTEPPIATLMVFSPCLTGGVDFVSKLGTEDIGMTETTPVTWKGELYRMESVRPGNWNNTLHNQTAYLRFRKQTGAPTWMTQEVVTSPFGLGYEFACAIVDGDRVYAFATKVSLSSINMFSASDLHPASVWTMAPVLSMPKGWTAFNTAVAQGRLPASSTAVYAMAIEVRSPVSGSGFHLVFATAPSVDGPWKLGVTAEKKGLQGLVFGLGSCPCLRYDEATGYWHMLYTPNPTVPGGDYRTWQIYAARSRSLELGSWEFSELNPVMVADAFDRQIHNSAVPPNQQVHAATTQNLNDSDADLVEYQGEEAGGCLNQFPPP